MPTGIIHSKVRGVTADDRQAVIKKTVKTGMRLTAIREPKNTHDKNAIGLWSGKKQVGYVSSDLAGELSRWMDSGKPLTVTVTELTGGGKEHAIGVNIVIDKHQGETPIGPADEPQKKSLVDRLLSPFKK
jgi:hypothetical protein